MWQEIALIANPQTLNQVKKDLIDHVFLSQDIFYLLFCLFFFFGLIFFSPFKEESY